MLVYRNECVKSVILNVIRRMGVQIGVILQDKRDTLRFAQMAAGEKQRRILLTDQGLRSRVIQKSRPDFQSRRVSNLA
jgi:hypothetical protein